ncbi:MAG: response regulator [Chitinivibrionales bacterium]|nr:response regulator [Chitinivibrionales bacterium]MBD3358554.1 response regulator [Chitinivibrionales bacterium]
MKARILLVDDEIDFLDVVGEFLEDEGYEVMPATSGDAALTILARDDFDLLLSDINMPGMKGFELLAEAGDRYPNLKRALITAYDVRDYMNMARDYDIGNIITKTTPFNFEELGLLVHNILTGDVFGLEHYVRGEIQTKYIDRVDRIESTIDYVIDQIADDYHKRKFRLALGEIVINAFFYGARRERGDQKHTWCLEGELAPDEHIMVSWARDPEKLGVAVRDQKGRLTKKEVLYWLERNTTKRPDGLAKGILDEHGKGLYITREAIDRFIVNIESGRRTEVVILNYRKGLYDGHQPLWIHEV